MSTDTSIPATTTTTTLVELSRDYPLDCIPNCTTVDAAGISLAGYDLAGSQWTDVDISGVDFTGSDLSGATFQSVDAFGAIFDSTKLMGATLTGQFSNTSFRDARFDEATSFEYSYLARSDFRGSNLSESNLWCDCEIPMGFSNLDGLNLEGAVLQAPSLQGSSFKGANLSNAVFGDFAMDLDLRNAQLVNTDFSNTNISGSVMTGANISGIRLSLDGVDSLTINSSQEGDLRTVVPDLPGLQVVGESSSASAVPTCRPHCQEMNFDGQNLRGLDLSGVDFSRSTFVGADLSGMIAIGTTFDETDFSSASLANSFIYATSFGGTKFAETDFAGCDCRKNTFISVREFTPRGIWSDTDFRGSDFSFTEFPGGFKFSIGEESRIKLRGAKFVGSSFYKGGFSYRDLIYTDFTGATLEWTDLSTTGFYGASLRNSDLLDAEVFDADFGYADIKDANLEVAVGRTEMFRLLDAQCGYETFASSHPDADERLSCQYPRP